MGKFVPRYKRRPVKTQRPARQSVIKVCWTCKGSGIVPAVNDPLCAAGEFCPTCHGKGRINQ